MRHDREMTSRPHAALARRAACNAVAVAAVCAIFAVKAMEAAHESRIAALCAEAPAASALTASTDKICGKITPSSPGGKKT